MISGLLDHLSAPFSPFAKSPQVPALAAVFLNEEHCPGARGLTEAKKARLKTIRDRPQQPAPKP